MLTEVSTMNIVDRYGLGTTVLRQMTKGLVFTVMTQVFQRAQILINNEKGWFCTKFANHANLKCQLAST